MTANLGFAAANNYAVQNMVTTPWVALINPDVVAAVDWFEIMIAEMNLNPDYGTYSGRLMQKNDPGRIDGAGDIYHVSGLVWRYRHECKLDNKSQTSHEILSPCAAAAIYNTALFRKMGGFDEDYFCYLEDVDLGLRLQSIGKRSWYVGSAVMLHSGSGITGRFSAFTIYHGHRNLVWTYIKNMPGLYLWRYLPQHLFMTLAALVYYTAKGRGLSICKAKIDAIRVLPYVIRKRRQCQRQRTVPPSYLVGLMTTGWTTPYLRRND